MFQLCHGELQKYNFIPRTLLICQVVNIPVNNKPIYYRNGSCGCCSCSRGSFKECERLEQFKEYPKFVKMTTHTFTEKQLKQKKKTSVKEEDDCDLEEDEEKEWGEIFIETEASKYIQEGDVAVIKTGDDHPYYLLNLTSSVFHTEAEVTDDYWHTFPPAHKVVESHYLEIHRDK